MQGDASVVGIAGLRNSRDPSRFWINNSGQTLNRTAGVWIFHD